MSAVPQLHPLRPRIAQALGKTVPILRANQLSASNHAPTWSLEATAGRLVEIVAAAPSTAALTACVRLILEAQRQGKLAAWVGGLRNTFFPPDVAALGIDLAALPVVRVDTPVKGARAADTLLRSGAFALIVLDFGNKRPLPLAMQTCLVGLAKKHHTALIAIVRQPPGAPGSMASLRVEAHQDRAGHDCFTCALHATKDKRQPPGWRHAEICHGTDGLC